jgi:starch phosphorylase
MFEELPVVPFIQEDGRPMTISVELPGRIVLARLWEIRIGRIPLYLLDSDVEGNSPADRELTSRLYLSDLDSRISQEIILGIGGVRALRCLGYNPDVWHMNEGHSAFMVLERIRELVAAGNSYEQAVNIITPSTIFTTHTPVPAGSDEFPLWLVDKYFSAFWPQLNLSREEFIDQARHALPWGESFSMPILALKHSSKRNGVSKLHGQVARRMWSFLWPERKEEDVPITHITNGVHMSTWLARRLSTLYDHYLGNGWKEHGDEPNLEKLSCPDAELWTIRRPKRKMAYYIRNGAQQWLQNHLPPGAGDCTQA